MTTPARVETPSRGTTPMAPVLLAAVIVLVALNLRAPITSVPPLLLRIADELHLGGAASGLLTTLPVLCMGLFAPPAQRLAHAVGREAAVAWALGLILVGTVVRLGGGAAVVLYAGALVAGLGIAIAGTVLPGVIKEYFADRSGLLTGLFMAGMMASAALASQLTVPLARLLASWQAALASWAVLSVIALLAWLPVTVRARRRSAGDEPVARVRLPLRSRTAWLLAAYMLCNSWQFYTDVSWIPATYEFLGRDAGSAASLLTIFMLAQAVTGVLLPVFADRVTDLRLLILPAVLVGVIGTCGVAFWPTAAPELWMIILGLGLGPGFGLGLVLLVFYAATPAASSRLTAMVFLVSYTLASVGPVIFGWLTDSTGGIHVPWVVLTVVATAQLLFVAQLSPRRPLVT